MALLEVFRTATSRLPFRTCSFTYCYSPKNRPFCERFANTDAFCPLDVNAQCGQISRTYDLIFSIHCKQIFPAMLVKSTKCINVHPGFNPFNRGWYPQVFSILNKRPFGATIHEMDEHLDHGPIIDQIELPIHAWDTSLSAYTRVIEAEAILLDRNLARIISDDYRTFQPTSEGNLNLKRDFAKLCEIDLKERLPVGEVIDRLRALSHGSFRNAYFRDSQGTKIFVKIELEPESKAPNEP